MAFEILQPRLQTRPVRAVLFDMDGLILDTEKLYCRFWQEAARSLGYPMTRQQALGMRALNRAAGQAKLTEYFGEGVDYGTVRNRRITLMDAFVEKEGVEAFPGIYPLLDYLQEKGIATAVASSSPMDRIEAYLTPLGLFHRFDAVCTGYDVPRGKPKPDIFLHAAARLGKSPSECLVLEDSPAGLLAAHRAGCLPVMIPDQDRPGAETMPLLFALADRLEDIIPLLDKLAQA